MATIDIGRLKSNTKCQDVAVFLFGPPFKESYGQLWWPCPFHNEKTPSFCVYEDHWRCYGQCGEGGDVISLVQKARNITFIQACEFLGGANYQTTSPLHRPQPIPRAEPIPPSPEWQSRALDVIEMAQNALYQPEGELALRYLMEKRGLTDEVIDEAWLGYIPRDPNYPSQIQWRSIEGLLVPCGILIPSFGAPDENGVCQLWGVRVRLPKPPTNDKKPARKYGSIVDSKLIGSLWGGQWFTPDKPTFIDEGEFNALSVYRFAHEFGDLNTCALSSLNNPLSQAWLDRLLFSPTIYFRLDAGSGDKVADRFGALSKRVKLIQVPDGFKDPNELLVRAGRVSFKQWVGSWLK